MLSDPAAMHRVVMACGRAGMHWPDAAELVTQHGYRHKGRAINESALRTRWWRYATAEDRAERRRAMRLAALGGESGIGGDSEAAGAGEIVAGGWVELVLDEVVRWGGAAEAVAGLNALGVPHPQRGEIVWGQGDVVRVWNQYASKEQKRAVSRRHDKAVVKRLVELMVEGATVAGVCRALSAEGLWPGSGASWKPAQVQSCWKQFSTEEERQQRASRLVEMRGVLEGKAALGGVRSTQTEESFLAAPYWPLVRDLGEEGVGWREVVLKLVEVGRGFDELLNQYVSERNLREWWNEFAPEESKAMRVAAVEFGGKPRMPMGVGEWEVLKAAEERKAVEVRGVLDGLSELAATGVVQEAALVGACVLGIGFDEVADAAGVDVQQVARVWAGGASADDRKARTEVFVMGRRFGQMCEAVERVEEFEARWRAIAAEVEERERVEERQLKRAQWMAGQSEAQRKEVLIERMRVERLAGLSVREVAEKLNSEGMRTVRGVAWTVDYVNRFWQAYASDEDKVAARNAKKQRTMDRRSAARELVDVAGVLSSLSEDEMGEKRGRKGSPVRVADLSAEEVDGLVSVGLTK